MVKKPRVFSYVILSEAKDPLAPLALFPTVSGSSRVCSVRVPTHVPAQCVPSTLHAHSRIDCTRGSSLVRAHAVHVDESASHWYLMCSQWRSRWRCLLQQS